METWRFFRVATAGFGKWNSKTVLGCKENRRYEMGVKRIVFQEQDFLRHPSSINVFPATSHCFAIIIYLISP